MGRHGRFENFRIESDGRFKFESSQVPTVDAQSSGPMAKVEISLRISR